MSLDVSYLLDDQDFCVVFAIERCTEIVDDKGRGKRTREVIPWLGVIQPATPYELERLPEADRDKETLTVYSREPLRPGQRPEGTAPDIILWYGRRYEVTSVETWEGYVRALATLLPEGDGEQDREQS